MLKKLALVLGFVMVAVNGFCTDVTLADVTNDLSVVAIAAIGTIIGVVVAIYTAKFVWALIPAAYKAIVRVVRGA